MGVARQARTVAPLHLPLSQLGPYLLEEEQYWQREPVKPASQTHVPFPPMPSEH